MRKCLSAEPRISNVAGRMKRGRQISLGLTSHRVTLFRCAHSLPQANDRDQQLATFDEPHRPTLSRVCCIAWFGLGTYFEDSTGLSAVSFAASAATSALMAMILGIRRIMDFWDNCIDFCINSGCLAKYALPAGD